MKGRYTALISTIANSFCDFSLDYAVNKYNIYKVLSITSFTAMIGQIIIGLIMGIEITVAAIPFVLLYGLFMVIGYVTYVKSLKIMPVGLVGLIESGGLFIVFGVDLFVGYLKLTPQFVILFLVFIISIIMFSTETNKISIENKAFNFKNILFKIKELFTFKKENKTIIKEVTIVGFLLVLTSMILYSAEPYMIKLASVRGANEIAINLGYYLFGTTFFFVNYLKSKKENKGIFKKESKVSYKFLLMCLGIAALETIYYVFGTMSFINDTPIIVYIIMELRVFLLVILSVIFKTDKMTPKKIIATILGMLAVAGLYFS